MLAQRIAARYCWRVVMLLLIWRGERCFMILLLSCHCRRRYGIVVTRAMRALRLRDNIGALQYAGTL